MSETMVLEREAVKTRRNLIEQAPARQKVTYEQFLDMCDEDTWAEWVDGEVIMLSPASPRHQDLSGFLNNVISGYVGARGLGKVLSAPLAMRLEHGREPDLLFVATAHLDRLYKGGLNGPADMVVEIVSAESRGRDRGVKYVEYEAGGVREYWLIDQPRQYAEFYHLGKRGWYEQIHAGHEGIFHSKVIPGFWLNVEWLWQDPLPLPIEILGEIAGVDPALVKAFVQGLAKGEK